MGREEATARICATVDGNLDEGKLLAPNMTGKR